MKKTGLTGNIGSGKTLVSEIFKILGIPVFNADLEARNILCSPRVIQQLISLFGANISSNGTIDRSKLASIVFGNPERLQQLNSIIHPEVRNQFERWAQSFTSCAYVIYEAAIIFESGFAHELNGTILVTSPEEIRITRVMKRDHLSREQVLARIKNQWPEEEKIKLAGFVICNNGEELLIPQVLKIHSQITGSSLTS